VCFALAQQRAVGIEAPRRYPALVAGRLYRAPRLGQMTTVSEAALTDMRPEFREATREIVGCEMVQTKCLHARRIDDAAASVEMVEPGMRGRMPAGTECT
jgi:hypothetical protein